jgi:hypothetical protein
VNDNFATSCSGTCRKVIFPFSFCSWYKESDVHRGLGWDDLSVEKLMVSTREEEDPIVDLQIDGRPVLSCLRIASEPMTQRVDEKGMRWFTKTWVPSVAGSMVMRSHVRIRSRDLTSSYPAKETWAIAALIGSHSGSCQCAQRRVAALRASQPIDYEAWKVRNTAQAIVAGFRPSGMNQDDYEAWKACCLTQAIAAGFWPWNQRPGFQAGGLDQRPVQDRDLDHDRTDGLTQEECRIRWWQNRCDLDAGIPLTFALTPAQVTVAKSSLGLRDAPRRAG